MSSTINLAELGDELRRRRDHLRLTLRAVEKATGVSAATLSRVERGSAADLETVARLAQWLGVSVHAGGTEKASKDTNEDIKRTIEVHLRAKKKLPAGLARSIADSFDFVMQVELERAAARKNK